MRLIKDDNNKDREYSLYSYPLKNQIWSQYKFPRLYLS
jgi:hypothetical protein